MDWKTWYYYFFSFFISLYFIYFLVLEDDIIKMEILTKWVYRFGVTALTIPTLFFFPPRNRQADSKFI